MLQARRLSCHWIHPATTGGEVALPVTEYIETSTRRQWSTQLLLSLSTWAVPPVTEHVSCPSFHWAHEQWSGCPSAVCVCDIVYGIRQFCDVRQIRQFVISFSSLWCHSAVCDAIRQFVMSDKFGSLCLWQFVCGIRQSVMSESPTTTNSLSTIMSHHTSAIMRILYIFEIGLRHHEGCDVFGCHERRRWTYASWHFFMFIASAMILCVFLFGLTVQVRKSAWNTSICYMYDRIEGSGW